MKRHKNTWKNRFQIAGTIGIVSVLLAVVLIVIGSFVIKDNENISKAEDYSKVADGTNLGAEYNLYDVSVSNVTNNATRKGIELLTVASSFYNYRYDNEIKKGWRDQGIDGELSGVGNPFSIFNSKLSTYYENHKNDNATESFGMYEGNFYNYWKGSYKNYNWCLENYKGFKWAQNIANRANYSAVCQGLAGSSLAGFLWNKDQFTAGSIRTNNNTTALPFYNKGFLDQKYDKNDEVGIGVVAENVGFPFRYAHDSQKGSYYVFDSKYDVVRFAGSESEGYSGDASKYKYYYGTDNENPGNASLNYYYQENQVCSRQNKTSQFLPFNKPTSAKNLDFGFGMRVDIPFYLTNDGCQVEADGGKPMKFNFEGDDDVWVFIDGKLVLDLGGAHAKTKGSIDFSTSGDNVTVHAETVSYSTYDTTTKEGTTTAGTNNFEASNSSIHTSEKIITGIQKDQVHVLTVFYMERGMIESNLYMDFNFIPHNEEIDTPPQNSGSDTDNTTTDSELTVKTEINFDNVAGNDTDPNSFLSQVKKLAEDDAFRYKIENEGTGSGNVQDSGIQYPSGLLSVRENQGKRTYWSYGAPIEPSKVRVYFDLGSMITIDKNSPPSGNGQRKWFWETKQPPYINDNYIADDKAHPMTQYTYTDANGNIVETQLYYEDVPVGTTVIFHNGYTNDDKQQVTDGGNTYDVVKRLEVKIPNKITSASDGRVYKITTINRINGDTGGNFDSTNTYPGYPDIDTDKIHSLNLPYETAGSVFNFKPANGTGYHLVANTSYQLKEYDNYLAPTETYNESMKDSTDIHIFKNNSLTSGKTDNKGIFSLLSEDSATFLKQFRMNSNMSIVQQDKLGIVDRATPLSATSTEPRVIASKNSGSFWDVFGLKLTPSNTTTATYSVTVNGVEKENGTLNIETQLTIGDGCNVGDAVIVKVNATGADGTTPFHKIFTYTKVEKPTETMYIRVKKSDFSSAPYVYLYNGSDKPAGAWDDNTKMVDDGAYYKFTCNATGEYYVILHTSDGWRSTPDKADGLIVKEYMEYDKTSNTFSTFTMSENLATDVSTIAEGTRKSKDFYYTKISAVNKPKDLTDEREVTVNKTTGEFKFANVKKTNDTTDFTSADKITITETFTNKVKTGNLCISKEVTGMKDTSGTYSFSIKFKDVFGVSDGPYTGYALSYKKYDANKAETTGTLDASNPIVKLKAGEKIIIEGIPVGTKYKIQETNISDAVVGNISISYQTKVDNATQLSAEPKKIVTAPDTADFTKDEVFISTGQTGTIEGMIPTNVTNSSTSETVNEFDEVDVNIAFTNQKGVLRIEKLAIGEWQNFKNEEYTFTITGNDTSINSYKYDVYEYNEETGESQIAKNKDNVELKDISITDGKIKLKATQWALIQDIPLEADDGKTYIIKETAGTYYKINSIDVNTGKTVTSGNTTNGTISMQLSYTNPEADITYVNRYDPAYITVNKYVDALYYQIYNTDGTVTEKTYSDVTDDEITYQELTNTKQSFIFTIDEYNTKNAAEQGQKQGDDYVKTFQVILSMDPKDSNIALNPVENYTGKDTKEHTYRYKNSKTIKLTLGRFYRISEDTNWSWKYDLQGIGLNFNNTTGKVHTQTDKYIVFEGGSNTNGNDIPVINFYNTLTEDETKLSTDGDTDIVVNIIKPTD